MTATFRSAGRTHVGKIRRHNEDAILIRDDIGLWAVADGLGGHSAGDYASDLIMQRLGNLSPVGSAIDMAEAIEDALSSVNDELRHLARERGVDLIGSTVAVAIHHPDYVLCGWVGDSRVYCFEDGRLRQITRDHAHGADEEVTRIGGGYAQFAPGVLTRAIGAEEQLFIDWVTAPASAGVQFLLCSDGINKEISDPELELEFRRDRSPEALVDQLFNVALSRAARDNLSAVIVRYSE